MVLAESGVVVERVRGLSRFAGGTLLGNDECPMTNDERMPKLE